jgi:hypothetical protein
MDQFLGAKLKVARAGKHLSELKLNGDKYFSEITRPFVIDEDKGKIFIITLPFKEMPRKFSLIIGDCLHNLRAALDHVARAMICPPHGNGDPGDQNLCFPISAGDPTKYEAYKRKSTEGATADATSFIDSLEPYSGGKHLLSELHLLDIIDKHKLLLISASYAGLKKLDVTYGDTPITLTGDNFTFTDDFKNARAEILIPAGKTKEDFKLVGNFQASLDMRFGDNMALANKSVYPTLLSMHADIKQFIEKCELHFCKSWIDISGHFK